jgi:hypothetical protein
MQKQQSILWGPTLQVNAVRLICATIVWVIIAAVWNPTNNVGEAWQMIGLPVFYLVLAPVALLLKNTGIGGFLGLAALIAILPGDPLTFLLRLISPSLVPMSYYSPLMFAYFLYVHD